MDKPPHNLFAGYFPVIDNGYMRAINRHAEEGRGVAIFDKDTVSKYAPYIRKEIRSLESDTINGLLLGIGIRARVLSYDAVCEVLNESTSNVVLIDDDISHGLVSDIGQVAATITYETPHLRWNRKNATTNKEVVPDRVIGTDEADYLFRLTYEEADKSSDWWRHVGAAIVNPDGALVSVNHNRGMPHDYIGSMQSDPRILSQRGSDIDISLFLHAEAGCIADAARAGASIEGGSIYVTTFPCPNCAKMIAASGIKEVYFTEGYAMLDGQSILENSGVKIIKVITEVTDHIDANRLIPYPEK